MSPRTRFIPLLLAGAGAGALLGACGEPPQPLPTSPPYVTPSAGPISIGPSFDFPLPTTTTQPYPTYPTPTVTPTFTPPFTPTATTPPETLAAAPTPPAARCQTEPTGAQILELVKKERGVPNKPLRISDGPFCSGVWTFAKVAVIGSEDLEPLSAVLTGSGDTLKAVAVGSDPCSSEYVRTTAPPGIRVLACGPERPGS